ncbi:MAG: M48 family metallopeptidase [Rhodospirillaceae bacterium]|nr:M48 family metallopeptidase [Rhodospirillaceae bacterium]
MSDDRFYDGNTATAHRVAISLAGDDLVLSGESAGTVHWPIADMRVVDGNSVTGSLNFARLSDPLPRLVLHDSPKRQQLLAANPALGQWKARARRRALKVGAYWFAAGIVIAVGAYFGWREGSAALAQYVPKEWEQRLGEKIYAAFTKNLTVCQGTSGNAALRGLVYRLSPRDMNGITIDVVDLKLPNALALPGDHVLVTSGLIELATSPDMLSAVVAHEIGHLDLRHPTQGVISSLGLGATIGIVLGGSSAGDLATLVTTMSYSRKMEQEADLRGLELLKAAGLRTDGMADFFKLLEEEAKESGSNVIPNWLASHPGLDERAAYTAGDSTGYTSMAATEWQSVKDVCKVK